MRRRQLVDAREPDATGSSNDPVWNRLREIIRALNNCPIVDGRLITAEDGKIEGTGLAFSAGVTRAIPHRLGRKAVGFFEVSGVDLPASGGCGLVAAAHPAGSTSDHFISVRATATGRTFLWVF